MSLLLSSSRFKISNDITVDMHTLDRRRLRRFCLSLLCTYTRFSFISNVFNLFMHNSRCSSHFNHFSMDVLSFVVFFRFQNYQSRAFVTDFEIGDWPECFTFALSAHFMPLNWCRFCYWCPSLSLPLVTPLPTMKLNFSAKKKFDRKLEWSLWLQNYNGSWKLGNKRSEKMR